MTPKTKKQKEVVEVEEIVWQIPESEYQPKSVSWHWLTIIAAVVLIAFAIWQKNFLFAIFVAIAFLTINSLAKKFPTVWQIKIDLKGILIKLPNSDEGKKIYPFNDLESFDVHSVLTDETEETKELVVKLKSKFSPFLKINIYSKDEEKIKDFLLQFVPQQEHPRSTIDSLLKLMKF